MEIVHWLVAKDDVRLQLTYGNPKTTDIQK